MASYKVSGLVAQGTASADDLLYLVDTEDGGSTFASKSITVGNFLNGYATESFVSTQLDALVNGAPAALDTLKELSDALGADSNFSTTITNLINANEVHVDNMATLTGVAKDDTDLGTFTGSTIGDGVDVKAALQALETSLETKGSATLLNATTSDKNDLVALSGLAAGSSDLGSFTGSIISDDVTIKAALQELETEVARVDADISTQINAVDLSGIATNATNITALQADLASEVTARGTAVTSEATTRANADTALSGRLDTLEADPTTATALSSAISTEQTARSNADSALSGRLDTLEADPTTGAALTAETTARTNADTALSGRLDTLEADPTTQTLLTAEATTRGAADTALSGRLDTLEADPTTATALSSEASTRASADTALSNRLDTLEADPTTQTLLTAEETARIAGDALKLDLAGGTMTGAIELGSGAGEEFSATITGTHSSGLGTVGNVYEKPAGETKYLVSIKVEKGTDDTAKFAAIYIDGNYPTFGSGTVTGDGGTVTNPEKVWNAHLEYAESDEFVLVTFDNPVLITENGSGNVGVKGGIGNNITVTISDSPTGGGGGSASTIGVDGTASFSGNVTASAVPSDDAHLVNKLYADNLVAGVDLSGIATNATAISALTNGAPELLNTLNELAAAIGDDENFATTITGQISTEATTRGNADTALSGRLDTLEADPTTGTALQGEISTRASADTALSNRLDTLEADPTTQTLLSAEAASRVAADSALSGRLDTLEADPTTATALSSEATTRANADSALSGRLDTLEADPTTATALSSAVTTLNNSISAEATARADADALLMPKAGGVFTGAVTGIAPTSDLHLATKKYADDLVANVDLSQVEQNRLDIIAEATARANAITALTNGAVAQNTAAIAAEVNTDRDAAISAAITTLTNGAVAQNAADILQEITDRQTAVAAETSARQTAVASLQSSITTTNNNVASNTQAITTEEAARVAADAGKVDKASSVNVHMVGETSAASAPVDAQGADNFLFLVVDKATGAIKSIEKSFLEAE